MKVRYAVAFYFPLEVEVGDNFDNAFPPEEAVEAASTKLKDLTSRNLQLSLVMLAPLEINDETGDTRTPEFYEERPHEWANENDY